MPSAVITGADGGIGRALVHGFAKAGYAVIATDCVPRPDGLACAHYVQADLAEILTDATRTQAFFGQIRDLLDERALHVLINNAALQVLGGADSLTLEDWRRTLDVNLLAPFVLTQGLLPELEAAQGCVVNISSVHARLTKKNFVAYATSKAALSGMTRALAVDLGSRVRVNAIEPAAIATEMLAAGFAGKREMFSRLEGCHPQERIGATTEVAALALAIAAGDLRFLHGACVPLDGGISGRLHDPRLTLGLTI